MVPAPRPYHTLSITEQNAAEDSDTFRNFKRPRIGFSTEASHKYKRIYYAPATETGTMAYACVSPLKTPVPIMMLFSLMPSADAEVLVERSQPLFAGIRSARR